MILIVTATFIATRALLVWGAMSPDTYSNYGIVPASDVDTYESWANAIVQDQRAAYSEVRIEYPPGSLPFVLIPEEVRGSHSYLAAFIAMCVLLDAVGLVGLIVLARRWGSSAGPWLWVIALFLLGPVTELRLDLAPAVATIWGLERASARDWTTSGGWFGFAAMAKLYPFLLLPLGFLTARRRVAFTVAALGVAVAVLLPLAPRVGDVVHDVLGYHTKRGIQVESTWGAALFVARHLGSDVDVVFNFGALHFSGHAADVLKPISSALSLLAVGLVTFLVWRRRERSAALFAESAFVLLALELTLGSVFSPQYLVWLIALGAVVVSRKDTPFRRAALTLVPVATVTAFLFPFLYTDMLAGDATALTLLWLRNLGVLGVGLWGLWALWRTKGVSDPSTEALASR